LLYNYIIIMIRYQFIWDHKKNYTNILKHSVSFEEALSVFYDENAIEFYDIGHSECEDRFLMLGFSNKLRLLLISYCYKETGNIIRIISARKATRKEADNYPFRRN
jgi:uncharacterized protein